MVKESVDFHRFGDELWTIANVLRADIVKVTEYLEEFSYFLFLKLLDDMERQDEEVANLSGKEYIPLIPSNYRFYNWAEDPANWAKIHGYDSVINFLNRMSVDLSSIKDEVDESGNVIRDRSLIRKVFQHHILRLRYDKTVIMLVKRLRELELESANYDVAGRAYEYLIQKLGEQGQYGQYFTPRHVVDFMVKLIDPEMGDKIYDPAAGTGGFLIWAYEHVIKNHIEKIPDAARQEIEIRKLKRNIFGTEKAPDVFKLGLMNLVLHRVDGSANFEEGDSLSAPAQAAHRNKYDVILTNPPFGPLVYEPSGVFEYSTKFFEASFLQHMMNALKPGGRCATVIKEGLLFSNTPGSLVKIRKRVVDESNLICVVSMPSGVFLPYTGSKTSILVFEKPEDVNAPRTEAVWFYRVEDDGFELGATRRPLSEEAARGELAGDLPLALGKFKGREESEKSWLVPVEKIRENDYNLTANRYAPYKAEEVEMEKPEVLIEQLIDVVSEIQEGLKDLYLKMGKGNEMELKSLPEGWEIANLGNKEIFKRYGGGTPKRDKREYWAGGAIPWVTNNELDENKINYIFSTEEKITEKGLENSSATLIPERSVLLSCTASIGKVGINEIELATNQQFNSFECNRNRVLPEFLAYFLLTIKQQLEKIAGTTTFKHIIIPNLEKVNAPIPPLEEQKQIVEILQFADYLKERRKEAKELIDKIVMSVFHDMFGDPATNPKGWDVKEFGRIIEDIKSGFAYGKYKKEGGIPQLRPYNITEDGKLDLSTLKYVPETKKNIEGYYLKKTDMLFNNTNSPELVGKTTIFKSNLNCVFSNHITRIRLDETKAVPAYIKQLFNYLWSKGIFQKRCQQWVNQAAINNKNLSRLEIVLPPLAFQQEFAEIVSELEDKRRQMEEAEERLEMLYQILLKQAFTGKLTEEWRMRH